jgi:hypothetical protein
MLWMGLLCALPVARAQIVGEGEVRFDQPIGSDILPGGGMSTAENIETSFVFSKLIPFVIKYGIRLAIGLSVVALIVGGFQFMMSYGNTETRDKATKTITWAIIGLIIAITAFGIVTVVSNISFVGPS